MATAFGTGSRQRQDVVLGLSTLGSNYDTRDGYLTPADPGLTTWKIACNDNYQGDRARSIELEAQGGVAYQIMIMAVRSRRCRLETSSFLSKCDATCPHAASRVPLAGGNPTADPDQGRRFVHRLGRIRAGCRGHHDHPGHESRGRHSMGGPGIVDCENGTLTMDSSKTCVANFEPLPTDTPHDSHNRHRRLRRRPVADTDSNRPRRRPHRRQRRRDNASTHGIRVVSGEL